MNMTQNGHTPQPEYHKMSIEGKILTRAGQFRVPSSRTKEEAFTLLKAKMQATPKSRTLVIRRVARYSLAVAASAALFAGAVWMMRFGMPRQSVVAERGHRIDYRLPDGSSVALNADTKITFRKPGFEKRRTLHLEGEAFFNVEKGSPFTVNTERGRILVLGTSFDVYSRDNEFKVSCFTGRVRVSNGSQSVIITPGEMVELENGMLVRTGKSDISSLTGWRMGEFGFENTPLSHVFEEIERQFNVTFVLPGIQGKSFTGTITDRNLVDALDIVCIPMGLTYEIGSNSQIIIKYKTD
jgi:ferric-dicitrate binding protein FerR (iron transport regulator)